MQGCMGEGRWERRGHFQRWNRTTFCLHVGSCWGAHPPPLPPVRLLPWPGDTLLSTEQGWRSPAKQAWQHCRLLCRYKFLDSYLVSPMQVSLSGSLPGASRGPPTCRYEFLDVPLFTRSPLGTSMMYCSCTTQVRVRADCSCTTQVCVRTDCSCTTQVRSPSLQGWGPSSQLVALSASGKLLQPARVLACGGQRASSIGPSVS